MKVKLNIQNLTLLTGVMVLTVGFYNAFVINAESNISGEIKFVKRLDEIYGITVQGRKLAANMAWHKLSGQPKFQTPKAIKIASQRTEISSNQKTEKKTENEEVLEAAVQENLNLTLVEVINNSKWKNGISKDDFSGLLITNNGVIEELSASLPSGLGLSVNFSEMTGNVFEYDMGGDLFSGMMYQVDQFTYMVTLTNGPLEGTKLRFSNQQAIEESRHYMASVNNVDVGNFGNNGDQFGNAELPDTRPEDLAEMDRHLQDEALQGQEFNFEETQSL